MKKKIILFIILFLVSTGLIFSLLAYLYSSLLYEKQSILQLITNIDLWLVTGLIVFVGLLFLLHQRRNKSSQRILKANKGEESHFLTFKEMRKNSNLRITKLSKLDAEKDGIPIYAKAAKKDIDIVLANPIHTQAIGTTGSGKTTGFVDPIIQILSRCGTKPSMVIADPKGELYKRHSNSLKNNGYNVQIIDLVDVYHSTKWNPFSGVLQKTEQVRNAVVEQSKGKYYFKGMEYLTYGQAEKEMKIFCQQLDDEIYADLQDIIYTVCPIGGAQDSKWQEGARDLILALALAFWEDVRDELMKPEKLCLYNLYKNISMYCNNECAEFKEYFSKRDKFSKTYGLANTVLVTQDKTLTSYLSDIIQYLNWMADNGLSSLTSGHEVELDSFDDEPNILFLRIPDHKENRYKIAKLLITQMYKAFVDKADYNVANGFCSEPELRRSVYFILDEFVNMPKFDNIVQMLRVGRSRKIFLTTIIQDDAGLDALYGKDIATSIRSNCNIKIFIGTTDNETARAFSESCGKHKVKSVSFSESKDLSVSTSAQEQPLISPDELRRLNDPPDKMGNAIVLAFGKYPLKAEFTPLFKAKALYKVSETELQKREAELFIEEDVFYDIVQRNQFLSENEKLARMQEEQFLKTIADLKKNEEEDAQPGLALLNRLNAKLRQKIEALKSNFTEKIVQILLGASLSSLPVLIEKLTDEAQDENNNFLVFELTKLKVFVREIIDKADEIENESANDN